MSAERGLVPGQGTILKVALPTPLQQCFDYRWCSESVDVAPSVGARVKVPFGPSTRIGVIVSVCHHSDVSPDRLKNALEILDSSPLLSNELLRILTWASDYYHHPLGEVIAATLPACGLHAVRSAAGHAVRRVARPSVTHTPATPLPGMPLARRPGSRAPGPRSPRSCASAPRPAPRSSPSRAPPA